jgi:hypothetical protein
LTLRNAARHYTAAEARTSIPHALADACSGAGLDHAQVSGPARGGCFAHDPDPLQEFAVDAWRALLTTDAGLLSLGVILFMLGMGGFLFWKFRRLMADEEARNRSNR